LGFRTRYADTAGGCEEVIAVDGRIRTGAGTGVELDKQNEADGAAEGKILAGELYLDDIWRNNEIKKFF
jgi:hypothetical protein